MNELEELHIKGELSEKGYLKETGRIKPLQQGGIT
jgi:hypothetical protein